MTEPPPMCRMTVGALGIVVLFSINIYIYNIYIYCVCVICTIWRQPSYPSTMSVASSFFCVLIVGFMQTGGVNPRVESGPDRLAGRHTAVPVSLSHFHTDK